MRTTLERLALGALAAALLVSTAFAAAPQTESSVGGRFGPSSKAEKHPRKAVVSQVVDASFGDAGGGYRFCAAYARTAENLPDKGSLAATVQLTRGEARPRTVGKIPKTKVSARQAELCTTDGEPLEAGDLLTWTFKFKGMAKIPSGDVASFEAKVVAPGEPFGTFRVSGGGVDETHLYGQGGNLIFCRTDAGFADLWVRLAEESAADGGDGPHVDLDLCNYAGGGRFAPLDPSNPSCNGAKTWDIFWHDAAGSAFMNRANAPQCELRLTDHGGELDGAFSCKALADSGGQTVDVLAGSFRCTVE